MTIVLQHQFWDLAVTDQAFEVGLSFGGVPERVGVPVRGGNGFFDPSVQFGLQFEARARAATATRSAAASPSAGKQSSTSQPSRRSVRRRAAAVDAAVEPPADARAARRPPQAAGEAGGEVVRLDRFRKK